MVSSPHTHLQPNPLTPPRAAEFEQEMKTGKDLAAVAREMADGVTDPGIQATEVSPQVTV